MKFCKSNSLTYVHDGTDIDDAIKKTTHLAIAAHQDDVEFMAYGGIVECFQKNDKHFSAVIATNGSGSPRAGVYKEYSDTDMMKIRINEQKKAAFVGEYSALALLMYESKEIKDSKNKSVSEDFLKILRAAKADVVYTHNLADKHDTHVAVALRVIEAIRMLPLAMRPKKLYGCEVWRGLDWLNNDDKILMDTSDKQNLANALMGVFDSQISSGKQYDTATTGRRLANATYMDGHSVDNFTHLNYAMDLTPLIKDDNLDISKFVVDFIDRFKNDVKSKISQFQ